MKSKNNERTNKLLTNSSTKLKPSEFLTQSLVDLPIDDYPIIIEFMNIKDISSQIHSIVDIDKPIFNPSPNAIIFEDYSPFAIHEKKLFFRNRDKVARRIKILHTDSPFFEVSAPRNINGQPLKQSKIAAGMEVCFIVKFKPQEVRDYSIDLTCVTEREKFLVPVRAIGDRPRMSFPDEIQFGTCPVKSTSRKMILAQNIGSCTATFHLNSLNSVFTCSTEDMTVEPGGSQMIEIFFTPTSADNIESDIEVEFTKKIKCYIKVTGSGKNVDVSLSTPSVIMEPSFISLSSQQTLRIHNHSDISIKFAWKSFGTREEEEEERQRLHDEITRMENIEHEELLIDASNGCFGSPTNSDIDDSLDGYITNGLSIDARAAQATLIRKYRNLRKALEHDPMHFVDDIFEITPIEGTVWAKSEIEITISFRPDTAASYTCLSYLDISGREDRLPLHLSGTGIGPHATLSFDIFDIGDVFINSHQEYEVIISNKGDISAEWSFIPSISRLSNKFKFFPREGVLDIGKSQTITIQFNSDVIGEFAETFQFSLQGSEEPLQCIIKGQVIGPTFHFDTKKIDFGIVSYDLLHTMSTNVVNTSNVDMIYKLYVPQDGVYVKKEFIVEPSSGKLKANQSMEVIIKFTPNTVKLYNYTLAIDIEGVGENVASIPLLAECIVSSIKLPQRELSFGNVFLRYEYTQEMTLINQSNIVETKCTILPQQQYSKGVAIYTVYPETVVVPVSGSKTVKFHFHSEKLGSFKIPVVIMVAGSPEPPIQAALSCISVGPIVITDKNEIRWGNVECLIDSPRTLLLSNTSLIPATCKLFLKMARSKYSLSCEDIILQPNTEFEVIITANLDDTIVHEDELHIVIQDGTNIMIPLIAKGIGTSIYCEQNIKEIDFGVQLTNITFEKKIILENKGRRQQQLKWINFTNREENARRLVLAKKLTKEGKRVPKSLLPLDPYFIVEPSEITLRPRTATTFIFKGSSPQAGSALEIFYLESKVGKERNTKTIITSEIKAEVVNPLLNFSEKFLNFHYHWEKGVDPLIQKKEITLTNQSAISLNFLLKVEIPFNLNSWEHTLLPGQSIDLIIEFDPMYKNDLLSHTIEKLLVVSYRGHPQKDSIPLKAEILFPNLEFETTNINFGCVLNDTAKTVKLRVKNWSQLDAAYEWIFLESNDSINHNNNNNGNGNGNNNNNHTLTKSLSKLGTIGNHNNNNNNNNNTSNNTSNNKNNNTLKSRGNNNSNNNSNNSNNHNSNNLSPLQIFDILPIRSILAPGASEDIEFTMFGHTNSKLSCQVICHVEGGPEYKLNLTGESSIVTFSMDREKIDFGEILFCEKKDETITITNHGKVPFNFNVNLEELTKPGLIEVFPSNGKINAGEHLKIIVRFRPGIPSIFTETVIFNLAHFDPVRIKCFCKGTFPAVAVTLPRYKKQGPLGEGKDKNIPELWNSFITQARENLIDPEKTRYPPKISETLQQIPQGTSALPPTYHPIFENNYYNDDNDNIIGNNNNNNNNNNNSFIRSSSASVNSVGSVNSANSPLNLPIKLKDPTQIAIDVEMHRIAFCAHLAELGDELNQLNDNNNNNLLNDQQQQHQQQGSRTTTPKSVSKPSRSGKRNSDTSSIEIIPSGINKIIVANYICDFGNVISGTSKKKIFKVMNASTTGPLTWIFDKQIFAGSGFSIDPDKISKLPEGGVVDIIVKFLARGRLNLGRQTCILPITMKNAPSVNLHLTVNVCVPDLILSSDIIDFERVRMGCSKKMYVRFQNTTPVTTHWSLKKPGISKDENRFNIYPMQGSVRSGQSVILEIEYSPTEARKHKVSLSLKIDMNNKSKKILTLIGEGYGSTVRFEPSLVEFGPILPFSKGDEKIITLYNDGDYPIEIYSLDFDNIYKEEDEILQLIDIYEADGVLRTPIRQAGEPLPKIIIDAYKSSKILKNNNNGNGNGNGNNEVDDNGNNNNNNNNEFEELHPPKLRILPAPRDENKHQDILIIGPVLSGVTTAAQKLGKILELPIFTIDQIIQEVASTISDAGLIARRILNKCTQIEIDEMTSKLTILTEAANKSRDAVIEAFKKQKKGKNKEIPEQEFRTNEVIELEEFQFDCNINKKSISKILLNRIQWEDCGYGLILDNVTSSLTDEINVINGISIAFPDLIIAQLTPVGGEQGYITRLLSLYEKKTLEIVDLKSKLEEKPIPIKSETGRSKLSRGNSTSRSIDETLEKQNLNNLNNKDNKDNIDGTNNNNNNNNENTSTTIEIALPIGDEPWVDQNTGNIIELSDDEFKSLENEQKPIYSAQIKYHRFIQLGESEKTLQKLNCVIDPETGVLKTSTEQKDIIPLVGGERILYYDKYLTDVCSELVKVYTSTNNNNNDNNNNDNINDNNNNNNEEKGEFNDMESIIPTNIYIIEFEEDHDANNVLSIMKALLPAPKVPPPDKNALPIPVINQIFKKPYPRLERKPIQNFRILSINDIQDLQQQQVETKDNKENKGNKVNGNDTTTITTTNTNNNNNNVLPVQEVRWVIPSKSSIQFKLHYQSSVVGKNDVNLTFEVLGTQQTYTLFATGICEVPQIQGDSRSVFMRRVKNILSGQPPPQKRYISSDDYYSFGPLLKFKNRDWRVEPQDQNNIIDIENYKSVCSTNMDIMRITNNGKYKCTVDFGFEKQSNDEVQIFFVEPYTMELEEGETKEIKIWAFPLEAIEYNKTLIACISNNPQPLFYRLNCWGVEPSIELNGSWEESLLKYRDELMKKKSEPKPDVKLIKEMELKFEQMKSINIIDFDRILINRTEIKSFQMKNTCLLPIAWEIDLENFKDSSNVTISPLSGIIAPNTLININISFFSREPLLCNGTFTLKYSDNENGLKSNNRIKTQRLGIQAEAYNIQAVSLTALGQQEGGNEVDMGRIRVGDYVKKRIKMGNRGKYRIGFLFQIKKLSTASLLKIVPEEGIIEPNGEIDIIITFCSPTNEINMKGNKDIRVLISEPLTGEKVEEFNLLFSATALFNRFRMQPAKGISFGAMRYDSALKTKRIELRNEGSFEFTYVVCGALAEVDEIDMFDPQTFACYAYATPSARRITELGDNYMSKLENVIIPNNNTKGGKKGDKKSTSNNSNNNNSNKGKSNSNNNNNNNNNSNNNNEEISDKPIVFDPDEITEYPIPENPLEIGAFTAFPRIGVVQPGECIGIDISFNPSGCKTFREKLRICLSGVDGKDTSSQWARSFEVVGESCTPAIVTDDVYSIFEEQQVVQSLAEIKTTSTSSTTSTLVNSGTIKIENIGIGKVIYSVLEKMLAFGPVMCGPVGGRGGSVERIKITNPTKIDVKVGFSIQQIITEPVQTDTKDKKTKPKDTKPKGKGKEVEGPLPIPNVFTVQPEVWEIPPHEHRYVNIYFNPTEIKSYRSIFTALVEDNPINNTINNNNSNNNNLNGNLNDKKLTFDLGGSGTMPCIAIEQPTERDNNGNLVIDFNRVHSDRTFTKTFILRNDGVMTTTCLFELTPEGMFKFPNKDSSLTLKAGEKHELQVTFAPIDITNGTEEILKSIIKISVLNNPFDKYFIHLMGIGYSCDAVIETSGEDKTQEEVKFPHINLTQGDKFSTETILLRSRSSQYIKFKLGLDDNVPKVLSCKPSIGHLSPFGVKEITITFETTNPIKIDAGQLLCNLQEIKYKDIEKNIESKINDNDDNNNDNNNDDNDNDNETLRGKWDDSMVLIRPSTQLDLDKIKAESDALIAYQAKVESENKKGKKAKPVGPPPESCGLKLIKPLDDGTQMVQEILPEPLCEIVDNKPSQTIKLNCTCSADYAKYSCPISGQNITFRPTYLYQSSSYKFKFKNESSIDMPLTWQMEPLKRKGQTRSGTSSSTTRQISRSGTSASRSITVPNPFTITPETCIVLPNQEQEFILKFSPLEVDDFVYSLQGNTLPCTINSNETVNIDGSNLIGPLRIIMKGEAKRPICHFNIIESPDYLLRRPIGMKNEVGLYSPIESSDLRIVELESTGLRVRNTFRFSVVNPTADNYEFKWEPMGDSSPFWRCALGAGILFAGKSTEMIFEYLPEEEAPAEAFFKFSLPTASVSQIFLFAGKVAEPRVTFATSKIDFHSVVLEGEGSTEILYIENKENIPFSFSFDKVALQNLEGPSGSILTIEPRSGTIPPNSRFPVELLFKPQEEIHYNLNISCEIKRKPQKLSVNIKGEGYAVHPLIQLESSGNEINNNNNGNNNNGNGGGIIDHFITLKPSPYINYADFGSVQVLDSITKTFTVTNNGKYNFDYNWETDIDVMTSNYLSLTGGKLGGTLQKGVKLQYEITFSPQKEINIDGAMLTFTVAGKYSYNIIAKGSGIQPAVRFSFLYYNFGSCFVTSPGGNTVIEETYLKIMNHDPVNNITIDCNFQKTRALWCECSPIVLEPGGNIDVPIRFAPRDVKEYSFIIPFIINGTGKVNVNIIGEGILPRLELANVSQRRTNFGLVNVGTEIIKTITLLNKSIRALPVQLCEDESQYGGTTLADHCVIYTPKNEFIIQPKDKATIQLIFSPNRRISQFTEELMVRYAGITRKILSVSGKAQGCEVSLDTDSLPFGVVVIGSRKVKKLSLENTGDLAISFQWMESTFGPHFKITPLSGKLAPGNEIHFEVVLEPQYIDVDIRQENIILTIPGHSSLNITCSGSCIAQPTDSIVTLYFDSLVRKLQKKEVNIRNPTDKDWFITPSLNGIHWSVPNEIRIPPKGSSDLIISYFPLIMYEKSKVETIGNDSNNGLQGQLFIPLPDGTAQLYKLIGYSGLPESSGLVQVETPAKKHCMISLKMSNWLSEVQKFHILIDIIERPSPATFFIAANAVEVAPHGIKEFQVRFNSYVEGTTKAIVKFINQQTGEYFFYDIIAKVTSPILLEDIIIESPIRQSAKHVITVENPLQNSSDITMGTINNPNEWWTCDSKCIRLKQLVSLSGNPEGSFEIEYRPLVPTKSPQEHLLTIITKELGTFKYKLIVTATPSSIRQTLYFEVSLGSIQTETFIFKTYESKQVTYNCNVKNPQYFTINKSLVISPAIQWDGDDSRLPIIFEPSDIGIFNDILTITSPDGGIYECELVGKCIPPLPLGPYNFTVGYSQDIPFRNCFNEQCQWSFIVDSPHFILTTSTSTVQAKTDSICTVTFQYNPNIENQNGEYVTAKLFIRCESKPSLPPWIVYLRGKIGA